MGKVVDDIAPGLTDVWKLWRNCCCRFGWYPIFIAPLITCAAFMDLYSSTGCDFIRLDIGFVPVNEVWPGQTAYLGLFSYDTFELNSNKWKRSFHNGCEEYSENFETLYIGADQTWQITRIMAYISGFASIIAITMAWLLTVTPLPASFFWPGVLLPAAVVAMLSSCVKFLLFDSHICTEKLWFSEAASLPVAPKSCNMGDSAAYAVASVAAYFICTILICIRSPTNRSLDPHYGNSENDNGNRPNVEVAVDTQDIDLCPELGVNTKIGTTVNNKDVSNYSTSENIVLSPPSPPPTQVIDISQPKGHKHTSSDVTTWTATSNQPSMAFTDPTRGFRVISPNRNSSKDGSYTTNMVWDTSFGVIMTVDDDFQNSKTQRRSNKSPDVESMIWKSPDRLPPLASSIRTGRSVRQIRDADSGSVCSRISKVSFAETNFSEESFIHDKGSVASSIHNSAPSVVSIPKKILPSPQKLKYSSGSPNRFRRQREDRNDAYSDYPRIDSKRERFEHLPRLDEQSSPISNDDHGELINACLRELHQSFSMKDL